MEGLSQCAINDAIRKDLILREDLKLDSSDSPPWTPERVKTQWESLEGRSWSSEYEGELDCPSNLKASLLRDASERLTYPQTILWALEKLNTGDTWTKKDTLIVHVGYSLVLFFFSLHN